MSQDNPESKFSLESHKEEVTSFLDKLRELLPGVEFEESDELQEARAAILEALQRDDQDPDLLRSVWAEYAIILEQVVDDKAPRGTIHQISGPLEIAALVHKALIYREIGDIPRYGEDLTVAEEYALERDYDEIATALGAELDSIAK